MKSPGDGIKISQVWIQTDLQCRDDATVLEYKSHKGRNKQSAGKYRYDTTVLD